MGMEERHNWSNLTKSGSLRCHFSSEINSLQYRLIPSREIADQRIQQSDWLRAFLGTTEEADFFWKCSLCRVIEDIVMHHFSCKKKTCQWIKFLGKAKQPDSGGVFGLFYQNENVSEKFGFINY